MNWFARRLSEKFFGKRQISLANDAFSDGQIGSKLWLCEKLESVLLNQIQSATYSISVYAGWYGLLPFLLLSRDRLPIANVTLYDLDPKAIANSLKINNHWRISGLYRAFRQDVNQLAHIGKLEPTVFINTSCEHFIDQRWWENIPTGSVVALQGTDMEHAEHVRKFPSLEIFRSSYGPWKEIFIQEKKDFSYSDFSFSRFLVIGVKGK